MKPAGCDPPNTHQPHSLTEEQKTHICRLFNMTSRVPCSPRPHDDSGSASAVAQQRSFASCSLMCWRLTPSVCVFVCLSVKNLKLPQTDQKSTKGSLRPFDRRLQKLLHPLGTCFTVAIRPFFFFFFFECSPLTASGEMHISSRLRRGRRRRSARASHEC